MTRADILEHLPTRPSHRARTQARRAAWQPDARDLEIIRLRDDEGLGVRTIAKRMGLSSSRVSYLYQRYKIRLGEREQEEEAPEG